MKFKNISLTLVVLSCLTPSTALFAQESIEEDVIEMSPFSITSDSVKGYATTSSLGASRVAIPITELASSLITINENLIDDTMARDLRDTFNMVAGVTHGNAGTGNQLSQIPSIRGYDLSGAQRDGLPSLTFTSSGGFDYALAERIEIIKGPAGVLYGSHSPGGVINLISKLPLATPQTVVEGRIGSFDLYRASLDHSGLANDSRLGYRIVTSYWDWAGPAELPNELGGTLTINPSLSYNFDDGLKVWAWYSYVDDEASSRRPNLTYAFGMRTAENLGHPVPMPRIAEEGSVYSNLWNSLSKVTTSNFEAGMEKLLNFGQVTGALRVVGRVEHLDGYGGRIRGVGGRNYLAANDVLIGTESRDIPFSVADAQLVRITRNASRWDDRGSVQDQNFVGADLSLRFDTGSLNHQFLTFVQYIDSDTVSHSRTTDISFPNLPADVLAANGWDNGRIEMWPNSNFAAITPEFMAEYGGASIDRGSTTSSNELFAWGAMDRISFLDDRVIAIVGLRHDSVNGDSSFTVETTPGATLDTLDDSDFSSKYGLIAKLYRGEHGELSLFYNNAETFTIETRIDTRLATQGQSLPNRISSTNEFGLKASLLSDKLTGTLSVFDNEENNFLVQRRDDIAGTVTGIPAPAGNILGTAYLEPAGTRKTKGWDLDLALNPVPGLNIILSYGDLDASISEGRVVTVPDHTVGAFVRYEFNDGPVKGLSAAWQYSAWGDSEMSGAFGLPATDRSFLDGDSVQNLILGYRINDRWNVNLKVDNVLDEMVVYPSEFWTAIGMAPDRSFTLSIKHKF